MLDLVRLSPRLLFPPGGVDLYRQIALLTEMGEDGEVLNVACGKGVSLEYFVKEFGVHGSGVDVDPTMIEQAEARSRDEGIADRLQFQTGRSDALPYRDEIFDATVGEIGLSNHCEPAAAISELVRVTKPGGIVVLVQLVLATGYLFAADKAGLIPNKTNTEQTHGQDTNATDENPSDRNGH